MGFEVLIVDDSSSMRSIIKKVLEISGFDTGCIYEASNGRDALGLLQGDHIDVILTDIHMPVMDGITLLKAVKEDPLLCSIPVIFVTTEGRGERIEEILAMGAKGFLRKPFKPEEIKKTLMEVLGIESGYREDMSVPESCDF